VEAVVGRYEIAVNGKQFVVEIGDVSSSPVRVIVNGEPKTVEFREATGLTVAPAAPSAALDPAVEPTPASEAVATAPVSGEGLIVRAPMPGKVLSIVVAVRDSVSEGDTVCTLEAMKMEMPISSTVSGAVKSIHAKVGDTVAYDDPLVTVS